LPDGGIHPFLAALVSIKAGEGGLVTSRKGYTPFEFLQDIIRDHSLFDVPHSGGKTSKGKEEKDRIYERKGPPLPIPTDSSLLRRNGPLPMV
jgi:hypothetical protein